jgi:hypothetical protein
MPEVAPDVKPVDPAYSNLPKFELITLCRDRHLPITGSPATLIERLRAWDAKNGNTVATVPTPSGDDPLDDWEPSDVPDDDLLPGWEPPDAPSEAPGTDTLNPTPEAAQPAGGAASAPAGGSAPTSSLNLPGGTFQATFPLGGRAIDDDHHAFLISETHRLAAEAGHQTRGGTTVGHRLGYGVDEHGAQTAVYEVYLRRRQ